MSYCERAVHNRILKNIGTKEDGVQLVERTGWSGAGQADDFLSLSLACSILHMNLACCSLLEALGR